MAEPGELVPYYNRRLKRWEWELVLPERCRAGHELKYPVIHLTWQGCTCRAPERLGHTVVICRTCDDCQLLPSCLAAAGAEAG